MKEQPSLSVVIPLYCEGSHLQKTLSIISNILNSLNETYELILIDDGSTDNTWQIIKNEAKNNSLIKAIRFSRNFGKESAICAGLEKAKGKGIIVIDGDLQHPPELIPEMVKIWKESEVDIVEAIKESRGKENIINKIGANIFYGLMKILSGYDLRGSSDYKLIDRKVLSAWLKMGERNLFFRGMIEYLGFKKEKIYFVPKEKASGKAKWSFIKLVRYGIKNITAFTSAPLHFVTVSGFIFLTFAFILGIQTLFMKFTGKAVSGFTTVILLLLIIGSLLMISLGIIGEYIARIYEEVKRRPRYVVKEVIDSDYEKDTKE